MRVRRFTTNPIVRPHMDDRIGDNINGPSLIRVPDWVSNPLGAYYLYFADHGGTYIRMAYADALAGPWRMHRPGVLDLADSFFPVHIASPDVHVLDDRREIRMYYHGCCMPEPPPQVTRIASSPDGLCFQAAPEVVGRPYWRAFQWKEHWYILEMPGRFRRSRDGRSDWEEGPLLETPRMRHSAVLLDGNALIVIYTRIGDCPERLLWTTVDLAPDWSRWQAGPTRDLLSPEFDWEGADCPLRPSARSAAPHRVRQLRDPCIFEEEGKIYILYSVAGESGIAIGELIRE